VTDVRAASTDDFIVNEQAKLQQAKEAVAGPVPLIPEAPDCLVNLPRGLFVNGSWKTGAEVRELTGADEEALSRVKEVSDFFDAVIAHGVVRIDDFDLGDKPIAERQSYLQMLLIGERDQLFMAITIATYGDTKTISYTCGNCQTEQDVDLILSQDFQAKQVDGLDQTAFTCRTSKGEVLTYRLATGEDQLEAVNRKGASMAEQNTVILSRCITKLNGEIILDPVNYARSMSLRDRQVLLDKLIENQPSISLTLNLTCISCRADQRIGLGWGDLFRP
jgi:hypothetical protein